MQWKTDTNREITDHLSFAGGTSFIFLLSGICDGRKIEISKKEIFSEVTPHFALYIVSWEKKWMWYGERSKFYSSQFLPIVLKNPGEWTLYTTALLLRREEERGTNIECLWTENAWLKRTYQIKERYSWWPLLFRVLPLEHYPLKITFWGRWRSHLRFSWLQVFQLYNREFTQRDQDMWKCVEDFPYWWRDFSEESMRAELHDISMRIWIDVRKNYSRYGTIEAQIAGR